MSVKRFSSDNSLKNTYKLGRGQTSVAIPTSPTISTATKTGSTTATVAYTDPIYAKSLIANYLLICGSTQYTFSPVSGFTNHTYVITLFDSISTSCNLRAVDINGNNGPATQNIPIAK